MTKGRDHVKHKTYKRITKAVKRRFLVAVEANGGIVSHAADEIGVTRQALYTHRDKDKQFREGWDKAVDSGIDVLEDEAKRRALHGVEEPVYQRGEQVGVIQRYSDMLMALMLRAHRHKYRERQEITGADGKPFNPVRIYLPAKEDGSER